MRFSLLQGVLLLVALALVAAVFVLWRGGGVRLGGGGQRGGRRGRSSRDAGAYGDDRSSEGTGAQLGSLARKVADVENGLDRHAQQVQALRTDVRQRLDALERRVAEAERRAAAPPRERPQPESYASEYEVETYGTTLRDPAPWAGPGASGRPVEVRDGMLVISHSLPPVAYAVPEGQGRARVFLNEAVEINEFALPKWEAFFEMHGARPYATYRTVRPAEVAWDAAAERGTPSIMGVAEAV